ncbi:DUF2865 domain-containing protein [Rhizobium sp. P32RR-XVIII]|uniref:DUF2865 domain-containing protein n=1 Tax=Rhizobium sp. P32RR-XVIII TaxID=2726738 RepID=UPI001456E816|nr:DUF2865 domain-containing protein [Rhizobium sp. P32RR-XVIII]NLS05109.1 DUF2865 domain-containing protein [Rhizobium sp. P32RR-XVIII]
MKRRNLTLALLFAFAAPAAAQTNAICQDLRARLANLPEITTNSRELNHHYASAIAEQNLELRDVREDMRRYGCSVDSMVVIGGENADYCSELEQAEARMVDNIQYLQNRRNDLPEREGVDDRGRRELIAALEDNGCNEVEEYWPDDQAYAPAPSPEEQAMRSDTFIPLGGGEHGDMQYGVPRGEPMAQVTTMCVRTCDGGFFPITTNATSVDFGRDAATCSKMCPGIETELFYQDIANPDAANMISASTGAPYSAMPNAFAYKKRAPGEKSTCSCNLSAYYDNIRKNQAISQPPEKGSITTIRTKPPATAAATPEPAPQPSVPDRPYDPANNKVRQVGPQFLAGDQGAIDLKKPATPGAQPQQN